MPAVWRVSRSAGKAQPPAERGRAGRSRARPVRGGGGPVETTAQDAGSRCGACGGRDSVPERRGAAAAVGGVKRVRARLAWLLRRLGAAQQEGAQGAAECGAAARLGVAEPGLLRSAERKRRGRGTARAGSRLRSSRRASGEVWILCNHIWRHSLDLPCAIKPLSLQVVVNRAQSGPSRRLPARRASADPQCSGDRPTTRWGHSRSRFPYARCADSAP